MKRHPSPRLAPHAQVRADRFFAALGRIFRNPSVGGAVLLLAAALAMLWANSPAADAYHALWRMPLSLGAGEWVFAQPLHFWINDVLMTGFFLVVGTEIRRELHHGALAHARVAALPVIAALGGAVVPALIYLAINDTPVQRQGWAVPTATDIAFAVGVLALLGRSIPANVRVFLLALAIIDDIAAVVIIAVAYSAGLDYGGLLVAAGGVLLVLALQRIGLASAWAYVLPGAVVWTGLLQTGAHPALAGVLLGLLTPAVAQIGLRDPRYAIAPATRVQHALQPWITYGVMPLFALANAGVSLVGLDLAGDAARGILLGAFVALVVGKPVGVVAATWIGVRLGWCRLPPGVSWKSVVLVGLLAGIGFTMSIFIATLAFAEANLLAAAKLGVLLASLTAAIGGLAWGRGCR